MAKTKTTIIIEADGDKYTMAIIEPDGKSGDRLDQRVAQNILKMDENLRRPETMQMLQNPQAAIRSMMGRMLGGMMPGMMGGMSGSGFGMM